MRAKMDGCSTRARSVRASHAQRAGLQKLLGGVPQPVDSTARPRFRSCSRGWTSRTATGSMAPTSRFRAWALAMLGRFDEARAILAEVACRLRRSRCGIHLGTMLGQDCVDRRAPRRRCASGGERRRPRDAGCSTSSGRRPSCRPRPETSRRPSTRSTGSRRPTPGPAARPSSARATTRSRRCSGGRSERRCSRVAASTTKPSDSPARRWRSPRRPRCSPAGRRARRPRRGARCSPGSTTRPRRPRAGARALRAQGQPRLGGAHADATHRAPRGGASVA